MISKYERYWKVGRQYGVFNTTKNACNYCYMPQDSIKSLFSIRHSYGLNIGSSSPHFNRVTWPKAATRQHVESEPNIIYMVLDMTLAWVLRIFFPANNGGYPPPPPKKQRIGKLAKTVLWKCVHSLCSVRERHINWILSDSIPPAPNKATKWCDEMCVGFGLCFWGRGGVGGGNHRPLTTPPRRHTSGRLGRASRGKRLRFSWPTSRDLIEQSYHFICSSRHGDAQRGIGAPPPPFPQSPTADTVKGNPCIF